MIKVITYGTYDLLHYGHIRLLERAKALGDYLIVGVTADDFDKTRGKINVQQSLMERIDNVRATGLANEIIVEEYEGQKIDDIRRYDVDIFTVGSDWKGKFDYLNDYCKVVYLERTEGISSSDIRSEKRDIKFGLVGYSNYLNKVYSECQYINGLTMNSLCSNNPDLLDGKKNIQRFKVGSYIDFLNTINAVYIHSNPINHYKEVKEALKYGKHVLCESPIATTEEECKELFELADQKGVVLMEAVRTAYSTAYSRLLLLIKSGKIGNVKSVDAVCTSLSTNNGILTKDDEWGSITAWGPTALLPIFQILGTDYKDYQIISMQDNGLDLFTKIDFVFKDSVASIKVGTGVKSEGELIISGTLGYIYVPSPWWKTDYFEIRFENPVDNRRYFYQLDGEGIRYELIEFTRAINKLPLNSRIEKCVTYAISDVIDKHNNKKHFYSI